MRISDWSSDVCSSDLLDPAEIEIDPPPLAERCGWHVDRACVGGGAGKVADAVVGVVAQALELRQNGLRRCAAAWLEGDGPRPLDDARRRTRRGEARSAERRCGQGGGRTCRIRWMQH